MSKRNVTPPYLTSLITFTALLVAVTTATQSAPASRTQNASRGRHNGKIVFISDRNYKGLSIWTINPDGSSPTRLTDDKTRTVKLPSFSPVYDTYPVWSPDGTKISFVSNRNSQSSLYIMNANGSNAQLITDKVIDLSEPAWSPDGGKIAFSGGVRGTFGFTRPTVDVYVINVDGSGLKKLTANSGTNGSPTWSPDGKQIAFSRIHGPIPQPKIWVMNPDGTNQRELPNPKNPTTTGIFGGEPAWSPDGTRILSTGYWTCRGKAAVGIHVVSAEGGIPQLLTTNPNDCGRYSSPKWSPDGTRILAGFEPEAKGVLEPARQIVVMNSDGSNQISIVNRGKYVFNSGQSTFTDVHADWQPLAAPLDFEASVIGFSEPSYTVYEDAGKVQITVTRRGNLKDRASCFYVTLTADMGIQHNDPAATGTLRFAPGESSKTISIPVSDSGGQLRTTSYRIVLSDNEGNATLVGGIQEAALTILGRDAASRKKN